MQEIPAQTQTSIICRAAEPSDCRSIVSLNLKWCEAYKKGCKNNGFLKNSFSFDQIQTLIADKQVVVAESQSEIIGYYLSNSLYDNGTTEISKRLIPGLILQGKLPAARYAYHSQAAINSHFMRQGISKKLLKELRKLVSARFDYLVGLIDKENLRSQEASLRSGWKAVKQIECGLLIVTNTKEGE